MITKIFTRQRLFLFTAVLSLNLLFAGNSDALDRRCETAEKFYLNGDYKNAAHESERLFKVYKTDAIRDQAAYIAALSYLKLDNYPQAREYFIFIINSSGDPYLVSEAEIGLTNMSKTPTPAEKSSFFSVSW